MTVYYEEEGYTALAPDCEELAQMVMEEALDYLACPYEAEISLLLTENERIQELNRNFRRIDRPTDVLSFPSVEYEHPGDFSFLENRNDCFNPETGELLLGDIVISKEKVLEQAKNYGHSVKREYAFLIAHSMLHLVGYDHIDDRERTVMERKQEEILARLNILR